MKTAALVITLLVSWSASASAQGADVAPPPWQRTETRADCADYDGLRRPFFGEQHIHTALSFDAYGRGTRAGPREAYDFAKGATIDLPDAAGDLTRPATIDRNLDWLMVADHALFFGEVHECITPGSGAFDDLLCELMRSPFNESRVPWGTGVVDGETAPAPVKRLDLCTLPGVDCEASATTVWGEVQAAAEEAYDRTSTCGFTSFIGYEHTLDFQEPLVSNFLWRSSVHRNLMFRNDVVPERAESAIDSALALQGLGPPPGDPVDTIRALDNRLWDVMDQGCNGAGTGCEVLAIPHNSNRSSGLMWVDPLDRTEAERRRRNEPVVEIIQQKGSSECRYDRTLGMGVRTADEFCTFEQETIRSAILQGGFLAPEEYFPRNHVRNALKDGLLFEQTLGANPFQLGVVGSTDNHNATSGFTTEDENWPGMRGTGDTTPELKIGEGPVFERSPGGLAVAWAEENSRDAIFEAFRRREVYGTSGTRPVVRFFAGNLSPRACRRPDFLDDAYRDGVPMGAEIGAVRGKKSPRFLVHALKDVGTAALPGTDLQRVQIVKGWVDAQGETHEQVWDVAGDPDNGASVDADTCEPTGPGFAELCAVWQDPEFDPAQRAFYYARVLDNPSCRWSTKLCQSVGVNPLSPDCSAQVAQVGGDFRNCCIAEEDEPFYSPVVQERAWSSPVWYRPEAIGSLKASIRQKGGDDSLKLAATFVSLPEAIDPATQDLTLSLHDDDEIYDVTLPAGTLEASGTGKFRFKDKTGALSGVRKVTLKTGGKKTSLKMTIAGVDLSAADSSDHFVVTVVRLGDFSSEHSRLWQSKKPGRLAAP